MSEKSVANDKNEQWIRKFLVRAVLDKHQTSDSSTVQFLKRISIEKFTNDGGYLITQCYKVIIELDVNSNDKAIAFFVKISPDLSKEDYDNFGFRTKFMNETIAYENVLPELGSSEDFPKFYYSNIGESDAVVAISDFSADGFLMSKDRVDLSLDHILAAMRALGRFHGTSFALKFTNAERFSTIRSKICRSSLQNRLHPIHEEVVKNGVRRALNYFRASDSAAVVPEEFLQKLEHVLTEGDNLFAYMRSRATPPEPLAVICHGDFLRNNIAFAYDSDGLATKAMLFDFQTLLYASPMLDLCVFMANSTGHEVRRKHFNEIFRTYYDAFVEHFLDRTSLSANELPRHMCLPMPPNTQSVAYSTAFTVSSMENFDEFLKEYAVQMPYGFSVASHFLGVLRMPFDLFDAEGNFTQLPTVVLTLGGTDVDRETHAQIVEMYELHQKLNLTLLSDA